jgi:hypothetical protein
LSKQMRARRVEQINSDLLRGLENDPSLPGSIANQRAYYTSEQFKRDRINDEKNPNLISYVGPSDLRADRKSNDRVDGKVYVRGKLKKINKAPRPAPSMVVLPNLPSTQGGNMDWLNMALNETASDAPRVLAPQRPLPVAMLSPQVYPPEAPLPPTPTDRQLLHARAMKYLRNN